MSANAFLPAEPNPVVGPYSDGLTPGKGSLTVIEHGSLQANGEIWSRRSGAPLAPRAEQGWGRRTRLHIADRNENSPGRLWAATKYGLCVWARYSAPSASELKK